MKFKLVWEERGLHGVTPLAGVWIEIGAADEINIVRIVTPLAGVWIEIGDAVSSVSSGDVTPLAGVWIEIKCSRPNLPD